MESVLTGTSCSRFTVLVCVKTIDHHYVRIRYGFWVPANDKECDRVTQRVLICGAVVGMQVESCTCSANYFTLSNITGEPCDVCPAGG